MKARAQSLSAICQMGMPCCTNTLYVRIHKRRLPCANVYFNYRGACNATFSAWLTGAKNGLSDQLFNIISFNGFLKIIQVPCRGETFKRLTCSIPSMFCMLPVRWARATAGFPASQRLIPELREGLCGKIIRQSRLLDY